MLSYMPADWLIAHRCVDLSARFGSKNLGELIDEAKEHENSLDSMASRFRNGFGVETDLRGDSRSGKDGILISHDLPTHRNDYPLLETVLEIYTKANTGGCLALNIKDAGLQRRLKAHLNAFAITNYFTFDGANPDVLMDCNAGITAFGRESEIEPFNIAHTTQPLSNYDMVSGIWLDNFKPNLWITQNVIERHFSNGKDVAIVSPELHMWSRHDNGEVVREFWSSYRDSLKVLRESYPDRRMLLCTKMPSFAAQFFNEDTTQ